MFYRVITYIKRKLIVLFIHVIISIMGKEKNNDIIISDLSILELKELIKEYRELTSFADNEISKKAKKTLLNLMSLMEKAIENGIMTGSSFVQKKFSKLGKENNKNKQK